MRLLAAVMSSFWTHFYHLERRERGSERERRWGRDREREREKETKLQKKFHFTGRKTTY